MGGGEDKRREGRILAGPLWTMWDIALVLLHLRKWYYHAPRAQAPNSSAPPSPPVPPAVCPTFLPILSLLWSQLPSPLLAHQLSPGLPLWAFTAAVSLLLPFLALTIHLPPQPEGWFQNLNKIMSPSHSKPPWPPISLRIKSTLLTVENNMAFPQKIKRRITVGSRNSTFGYMNS